VGWDVHTDESGKMYIDGERVIDTVTIGHGSQYTVSLAKTESGRMFILESGISGRGQYNEVLTELTDLDAVIADKRKVMGLIESIEGYISHWSKGDRYTDFKMLEDIYHTLCGFARVNPKSLREIADI